MLHETRKRALAKMLRALAGVLATAAALNPSATTRRQLGAGLAGGGLALVAAPPAFAEVLDIPPATTKMGGLLEKYADVARGARKLRRSPARRRRGAGATAGRYGRARTAAPSPRPDFTHADYGLHSPLAPRAGQPRLSALEADDLEPVRRRARRL